MPTSPHIADSILDLIGRTPLLRLGRLPGPECAEILVKLEAFNPAGSVKDRVALAMIEAAERDGRLRPGDTIVEPTSGNTGIGLALVAAVKGYHLIITMPDDASIERQRILAHYGARVILTPARKLMAGAIARAREIVASNPRCFMPQQFDNPANPHAHRAGTAREILAATEDRVDALVAGVGTGGTITGVGQEMRAILPELLIVAVEPERSPALTGGRPRPHGIEGIGAGFVPPVLDRELIDEVLMCTDDDAYQTATQLAREEGISAGMSGGAAVWAALAIAERLGPGKRVVTVIPDAWDRYATLERPACIAGLDFII